MLVGTNNSPEGYVSTGVQVTANSAVNGLVSLDFASATKEVNISNLARKTISCGDNTQVVAIGAAKVSNNNGALKFDASYGDSTLNLSALKGNVNVFAGSVSVLVHDDSGYQINASLTGNKVTVDDTNLFASSADDNLNTLQVSTISNAYNVANGYVTIGAVQFKVGDTAYIKLKDDSGIEKTYYKDNDQLVEYGVPEPEPEPEPEPDPEPEPEPEPTETDATQTITDTNSATDINEAFARVDANATANTTKQLIVGDENWNSTISMGNKGTSVVVFEERSTSSGVIDKGTNAGVIAFADTKANLSQVTIINYDSTKDTLATPKKLLDYIEKTNNGTTANFIRNNSGKYGTDLMEKSGTLASTKKDGFYQTKYGEIGAEIGKVSGEILVVAGGNTAASGDFSNSNIAIFAMTDNNDVADTVKGSANVDYFVAGIGDNINGGKGNDVIRAYKSTVQLATSGEGNDSILNLSEYNEKDTANNALNLNASKTIKDLELSSFTIFDGKVVVKLDDGSTNAGATVTTTKNSGDTFKMKIKAAKNTAGSAGLLAELGETEGVTAQNALQNATAKSEDKEYAALLVNTGAYDGVTINNADADLDAYYGVKGKNNQVSFGSSKKTNIFLGASGNGEEWGDTAVYSDITNVKTSNVGNSLLINGTGNNATLEAAGANDSLWGGIGGSNDLLVSNKENRTNFAAGYDNGRDTIEGFKYGLDAKGENQAVDVVYFLDGASYLSVEGGSFIAGTSEDKNIKLTSDGEGTKDITFAYELGKELSTARVDMTNGGNTNIEYDENAEWYIGQGESSAVNFGENAVQIAFNSKYGALNVVTLNAANTKDGSIINGSNDLNQTVIASGVGSSSICGGFYGDFVNGNNDTLIGGGEGNDTFYVGKNMGSDVVTNATNGDTVIFLASKMSDVTGINTSSEGFSVNFDGTEITIKLADGKSMTDMKNLTANTSTMEPTGF